MRVLIGIEQELMRYGFIQLLNDLKHVEYTVAKITREEILRAARKYPFDFIVLHTDLKGAVGYDSIFNIASPETFKLLITSQNQIISSSQADAVLSETLTLDEWMVMLDKLFSGEKLFNSTAEASSQNELITKREEEVFRLKLQGYSVGESAAYLNISPKTIENHRRNIAKKADLKSNKDWVETGKQLGFI
ncbi:LuxR C-terminal-related transcriptional regulator [Alkalicoccus daliensis]|uniref:Two-component system, NarL family, invasion response regulator UvrY n=1 Tax=Alkalicoccus daliensis TaxID=745820 RepID=A0A1H0ICU0_9BACI|nr:LuxR C-terminal-related transcriptional regulator [Alkalicoccus daliensis]SDO29257.1 two-component system, NarL family, invasion response regulator UvrY [Alkalicoccus daliensis]